MTEPLTTDEKLALAFHSGHQGWDATWHAVFKNAARRAHAGLLQKGLIEEFTIGQTKGVGLTAEGKKLAPGFPSFAAKEIEGQ